MSVPIRFEPSALGCALYEDSRQRCRRFADETGPSALDAPHRAAKTTSRQAGEAQVARRARARVDTWDAATAGRPHA